MHESWKPFLKSEFDKPYFKELSEFLHAEYDTKTIFPPKQLVFSAFATDLNEVKVVILGQDPYHTPGAAEGLAFSVPQSQPIPPSLINIYKEIDNDIGSHANKTGSLRRWQAQGVLLLNTVLTVEAHRPKSHSGKGWEIFTTEVKKKKKKVKETGEINFKHVAVSLQSCPALCDPMDCSLPGPSIRGILQARTLEWVAMLSSRGSSHLGIHPASLESPALAGGFFSTSTTVGLKVPRP